MFQNPILTVQSIADSLPNFSAVEQEGLMRQTFEELKSCKSYWARKSKLLTIANRAIFSKFQLQLIEFDVSLFFGNIEDASKVVEQIFPPPDASYNFVVKERVKSFLLVLTDPTSSGYNFVVLEFAEKNISTESLIKMYLCVFSEELISKLGTLSLYVKIVLSNPKSVNFIAMKLWESYLCVLHDNIENITNLALDSSISHDGSLTLLNDSKLVFVPANISAIDLIFFHLSQALIDNDFGDLTKDVVLQIYNKMLACTFYDSLHMIPKDYYRCKLDEKLIKVSSIIQPKHCWHICASFVTAIYQKFGGSSELGERNLVTKIMVQHVGLSKENRFSAEPFSFVKLAEDLIMESNVFDVQKDFEVFRLLVCYALIKTQYKSFAKNEYAFKAGESLFVYIPPHFCDVSVKSLSDYWLNDKEDDDLTNLNSDGLAPESTKSAVDASHIQGTLTEQIEAFKMLFWLCEKCEISKVVPNLFDFVFGSSEIGIGSNFLQSQMIFGNYASVIRNFSQFEKMALGVRDKHILKIQYIQICFALKRSETLCKVRSNKKKIDDSKDKFHFGLVEFRRILDFVIEQFEGKQWGNAEEKICQLPEEISEIVEKNCYVLIENGNARTYVALCLFHVIWCELLVCFVSNQKLQKISKKAKVELSEKIGFLIGFLLCFLQLLWDDGLSFLLFQDLLEHIVQQGELRCDGLINYLNNLVLLSHLTTLDCTVKLLIIPSDFPNSLSLTDGASLLKAIKDESIKLTNKSPLENFKAFFLDHEVTLQCIFEK